jgi:hypothetical protein
MKKSEYTASSTNVTNTFDHMSYAADTERKPKRKLYLFYIKVFVSLVVFMTAVALWSHRLSNIGE